MTPNSINAGQNPQNTTTQNKIHQGSNIKRLRLLFGLTQQELALKMGANWNQKRISRMEGAAKVMLKNRLKVAQALDVNAILIQDFDQAAGQLVLSQVIQAQQRLQQEPVDDPDLLEMIQQLLMEALHNLQKESQRLTQIAELLDKARELSKQGVAAHSKAAAKKSVNWSDIARDNSNWEVKEPGILAWVVCAN